MTNGAGHMRLDERGLEAVALALKSNLGKQFNAEPLAFMQPDDWTASGGVIDLVELAQAVIESFLAAIVPGDVRELVERAVEIKQDFLSMSVVGVENMFREGGPTPHDVDKLLWKAQNLIEQSSAALLTLSAENATLKSRLDGTVGVEIIGKGK